MFYTAPPPKPPKPPAPPTPLPIWGERPHMAGARFERTDTYVATGDLMLAVNAAITLERPLLIKGEPGTGKTMLAEEVARAIGAPLIPWHIKSITKASQGLYEYDAVARLRDSQLGDDRVHDIRHYIVRGKLWEAFASEVRPVLLIDEIDKADIEFPNDLLHELDRMEFYIYETRETVVARHRPIIIITSNNEKELPDAFLRRCFFHYIRFPDRETMTRIVGVHFPGLKQDLRRESLETFFEMREVPGLKKTFYEIAVAGGSVEHWNEESGGVWMGRVLETWPFAIWLNSIPEQYWAYTQSIQMTREMMGGRMFPLTIAGLESGMAELRHRRVP